MKYIRRSIEEVIENSAQSFKAVLVTGARQTGKLTLLQELFPKRKTITFEDQFLEDQARENPDMFLVLNAPPVTMDEVQRVPDVHAFPGHIACDSASRSEIVLPLHRDGAVAAVLDIDSPRPGRFGPADEAGLRRCARLLEGLFEAAEANAPLFWTESRG